MNRQLYVTSDRWSLHKEDTFRQIGKTPTIWHTDDTRGLARTAPPSEPGDILVGFRGVSHVPSSANPRDKTPLIPLR